MRSETMSEELPRLGQDTLQTRAAQSGQIWNARQRARDQVADSFETVDNPDDVPVRRRGQGFGPADEFLEWAEPQEAAHQLDPQFPDQDLGASDVRRADDGFRPTETVEQTRAANELDPQFPLVDLGPDDVERSDGGGFGLTMGAQRTVAAERFEEQTPLEEVDPQEDIQRTDDGFELGDSILEENSGLFF